MTSATPLLECRDLSKTFRSRVLFRRKREIPALRGVNLTLRRAETTVVAGESGAGKSTLARCLAQLEKPDSGCILYNGTETGFLSKVDQRALRPRIQLIFQSTSAAMNPRFSCLEIVEEPLRIRARSDRREQHERAASMMQLVGLSSDFHSARPLELSGGERQRLAIARALIVEPELLILDEALAGLDSFNKGQLLMLLKDLQVSRHLSYCFITHDMHVASLVGGRTVNMVRGRICTAGQVGATSD